MFGFAYAFIDWEAVLLVWIIASFCAWFLPSQVEAFEVLLTHDELRRGYSPAMIAYGLIMIIGTLIFQDVMMDALIRTTDKNDRLLYARKANEWYRKVMTYRFFDELKQANIMQYEIEKKVKRELTDYACNFVHGTQEEKQKIYGMLVENGN